MKLLALFWRCISPALIVTLVLASLVVPGTPASAAATTGTISGTIVDASTGAPVADATVTATAPSGSQATTTDKKGFYVLQQLLPDTYTVAISATGYLAQSYPGITVVQGLAITQNSRLATALKTIAKVSSHSGESLVRPDTTSDSYTVTGAQLTALSLGNDLHKTLYQYTAMIPGITGSGYGSEPTVHGGSLADVSYEFDGIPINEQMTGDFTTNLSNGGIGSILVSTGGLNASESASGIGFINTVVKSGTYPGFADVTYSATPQYRNVYEEAEYGGATKNQKFSWYFSADITNALNEFTSGQTYPLQLIEQANGPGKITTADLVMNLHWRPTAKDDIQFLVQNGLGEFGFGYLMQRAPGEPLPLSVNVCPGATAYSTTDLTGTGFTGPTYTGGYGGVAPNGQTCPEGLYWGTASTQQGGGNYWHHYSGIGKLQWNHIINDHSSFNFRLSENFNQYIFDQPIADANLPQYENNDAVNVAPGCPAYPYYPGTPVASAVGYSGNDVACMQLANWVSTGYYEDRNSRIWSADLTYDNTINANADVEFGVGHDYSPNNEDIYFTGWFNPPGTSPSIYPSLNWDASFPTYTSYVYAQGDFKFHKFLVSPGLRYTSRRYAYDIDGGATGTAVTPSLALNYAAGINDVFIGSFTDSSSLVPTDSVYRYSPASMLNGPSPAGFYCSPGNTVSCGTPPTPTLTHSFNLMWEHQINPGTSFKFGPYYDDATNILLNYTPLYLNTSLSPPVYQPVPATAKGILSNIGIRRSFGFELGLNHDDPRPSGISYWIAGTFDNFWTNSTSPLTTPFGNYSLPPSSTSLLRSGSDPPLSGSVTLDLHENGWHLIPQWYLQSSIPYYSALNPDPSTGNLNATEAYTAGYGIINATLETTIGKMKDWTVGVQGMNILNNNTPLFPCYAYSLSAYGNFGTGCYGMQPVGANTVEPGAVNGQNSYPTVGQSTPLFFFFITKKL